MKVRERRIEETSARAGARRTLRDDPKIPKRRTRHTRYGSRQLTVRPLEDSPWATGLKRAACCLVSTRPSSAIFGSRHGTAWHAWCNGRQRPFLFGSICLFIPLGSWFWGHVDQCRAADFQCFSENNQGRSEMDEKGVPVKTIRYVSC